MVDNKTPHWQQRQDPRWQKKRLDIMNRDKFKCLECGSDSKQLNVHHRWYVAGRKVWEYPDLALMTLCEECHQIETEIGKSYETHGEILVWEKMAAWCASFERDYDGWGSASDSIEANAYRNDITATEVFEIVIFALGENMITKSMLECWRDQLAAVNAAVKK